MSEAFPVSHPHRLTSVSIYCVVHSKLKNAMCDNEPANVFKSEISNVLRSQDKLNSQPKVVSDIVGLIEASQDMFYIYASFISLMFLFLHPEFIRFLQATEKVQSSCIEPALHNSKHNEHYTLQQQ